jgi:phenylacetate-CoA ligase
MNRGTAQTSLLDKAYIALVNPILSGKTYWGLGRRLKRLQRMEGKSLAENKAWQWLEISHLLQHAYDSTPFYRQRFERAGMKPTDFREFEDLQKIPPLTREEIRTNLDGLWSRRYSKESLQSAATGGTTDTPVPLLRSPECLREKLAAQLQLNSWAKMLPGDKVLSLWGAQQDFPLNPSLRWRFFSRYVMRRVTVPTSHLNAEVLEFYRQLLNEFRPKIIYAYPAPLTLFCEYLRDSGLPYHDPKSVICTAEALLPQQRQIIEQTLCCQAFEHYGSRDFGMIGAECEAHQGIHLHPAAAYVEFVPVEGAEAEGLQELLVTDLFNRGMPLIRYRINDCAILGSTPCGCGRGFPLIKRIVGRTTDNFSLPDGSVVPGVALTNRVIQVCPGIRKLQVVQTTLWDFHVRYVPGSSFSPADLQLLTSKLNMFFSDQLHWTFERVNEIEREPSGKTRFCISHVRKDRANSTTEHVRA